MFSRFESNKNMLQHLNRPCHGGIRTLLYSISQRKMIRQQAILYILHSLILLNTKTHFITMNTCIWVLCLCKCLCSCVEYNSEVRCLLCCELWALIWLLKTSVTTDLGCFVMLHSTDRQEKKKKIQACHFCCLVFGISKLTQIVSLHPWLGNYIFR